MYILTVAWHWQQRCWQVNCAYVVRTAGLLCSALQPTDARRVDRETRDGFSVRVDHHEGAPLHEVREFLTCPHGTVVA